MGALALAAIDARIATWSARWFGRAVRRQEGAGAPPAIAVSPMPRHGWRRFAPGIWLDWGKQTSQTLALHALSRPELRLELTADDERLVATLGERVAFDLAASLVEPPARPVSDRDVGPVRAMCLKLCSASQALGLAIAIDTALLVRLRKQQSPRWQARDAKPQSLAAALGSVEVAFEVALGSVKIGLLEFEAIEPGDTIVLDQWVAAPITVRSTANKANIRDTRLVREDGQLTLTTV